MAALSPRDEASRVPVAKPEDAGRPLTALARAADRGLLPPGRPLLVACSGGIDSMSLVRALLIADRWPLRVATVDHGLRDGSAAEAERVRRVVAGDWGVPVDVLRADPGRVRRGEGPEDAARRERYRLLEACAARHGVERVVTAHTADDQAETLLMRLAAGAGTRGVGGIPERRGRLARPWLEVTRAEVEAFAAAHGVPWRRDPTNDDERPLRNRLRRRGMGGLAATFGPDWVRGAARSAAHVRADAETLDFLLDGWSAGVVERRDGAVEIDRARFDAAPGGLRRLVLVRALGDALRLAGGVSRRVAPHVDRLEAALAAGPGPRRVGLPAGLEARIDRSRIRLGPSAVPRTPAPPLRVDGPGLIPWGRWLLEIEPVDALPPAADRGDACVDRERAPFPWRVRAPQRGERYRPLGAPGAKRIGRLWIDARVPREERGDLPVVEAGGALVWVAGLRVAHAARVRPGAAAWRIRLRPADAPRAVAGGEEAAERRETSRTSWTSWTS